jgi:hypothetical protein
MKPLKRAGIAALPLALCGCLEVDQHPGWREGGYAGKTDQLPYAQHFYNDRLAWSAALTNRALYQNEFVRAKPPGMAGAKRLQDIGATPAENTGPLPAAQGSPAATDGGTAAPPPAAAPAAPASGARPSAGSVPQPEPGGASPAASGAARPPATR